MKFLTTQNKWNKWCVVLLLAMFALPVVAKSTKTITIISGEFNADFATDLQLAKKGNAKAQNSVGMRYLDGFNDVIQDSKHAKMWFEKAAAQGLADAQSNLGYMYMRGLGVKKDYAKAKAWYEKAAAKGYAEAQNNLGTMYVHGLGVKQDYAKAKTLFKKAAAQGLIQARKNLNYMRQQGLIR